MLQIVNRHISTNNHHGGFGIVSDTLVKDDKLWTYHFLRFFFSSHRAGVTCQPSSIVVSWWHWGPERSTTSVDINCRRRKRSLLQFHRFVINRRV